MSDIKFSLINASDWSKPVEKLIESISSAIGVLYEPTRIRRKAKAETEALKIRENLNIENSNLKERAQNRFNNREIRRQKNIEKITELSANLMPEEVDDEKPDDDWIFQFFNECQDIENDEIQLIWSKI